MWDASSLTDIETAYFPLKFRVYDPNFEFEYYMRDKYLY